MAGALHAQAPANDNCSNAIAITLNEVVSFSNAEATTDGPNHPTAACFGANGNDSIPADIWYLYTATATANLIWTTCNTVDFDTRMAVYNGGNCPVFDADLRACNDDGSDCANFSSILAFDVVAGQTYLLRLGGYDDETGSGTVVLQNAPTGPPNNDCANAEPIGLVTDFAFNTATATTDGPSHTNNPCFAFNNPSADSDIWYSFTPTFNGAVEWSTCNSATFDTRLAVYGPNATCPVAPEDLYACNDDGAGCANFSSRVTFAVTSGQTYLLRLGGFGESGPGSFNIVQTTPPMPPANDDCSSPEEVFVMSPAQADGLDIIFNGTTFDAGFVQSSFQFPTCLTNQNGGEFADVWYTFNNLGNQVMEIRFNAETTGSAFFVDLYDDCNNKVAATVTDPCFYANPDLPYVVNLVTGLSAEPREYYLHVTTRLTSDFPGNYWFQLVGDNFVSTQEPAISGFRLFPNPVRETLHTQFALPEAATLQLQVFNALGQQVYARNEGTQPAGPLSIEVPVAHLPAGIYHLDLRVNGLSKMSKFVKH